MTAFIVKNENAKVTASGIEAENNENADDKKLQIKRIRQMLFPKK